MRISLTIDTDDADVRAFIAWMMPQALGYSDGSARALSFLLAVQKAASRTPVDVLKCPLVIRDQVGLLRSLDDFVDLVMFQRPRVDYVPEPDPAYLEAIDHVIKEEFNK